MNPIEHYREAQQKMDQIAERESAKRQVKIEAVDAYIEKEKTKGMSTREILRGYVKEYYHGFLDNQLIEEMNSADRLKYLKELIFEHGIPQEEQTEEPKRIVH